MFKQSGLLLLVCVLSLPSLALGQGLLVDIRDAHHYWLPRPPIHPLPRPRPEPEQGPYKIKELSVQARLSDQVATVQVSQSFVNTGHRQMEVSFVFPLPYDGAVSQLTLMVDGKEYEAQLLSAEEARRIYESYVRRNRDPALLEWMGTGMYKTSVFPVPAGAERTVTLRYTQVCRKQGGLTEFLFPLSTAKYTSHAVEKVSLQVNVGSRVNLKNVYSPTHAVRVEKPTPQQATVRYDASQEVPTEDFRLFCDVGDETVGASVLGYRPDRNEDGYFLLLVSPDIKAAQEQSVPKTVIFVVDRSGSMSGEKFEQAKGALRFVLNNLREGDLFNIVAYDSTVESFRPELERFSDQSRKEALGFVEGLYAGGSTNIDQALSSALGQLRDGDRPSYVIFLTDGLPTVGEKKEGAIVQNAKQANRVRARIFSFGVGYDVNSRLLDKVSGEHFGQSRYVRPNEDIEAHVSQLYQRIGSPVMTDVKITWDLEGVPAEQGGAVNRMLPEQGFDLFAGDQLVVAGRYRKPGTARVTIQGTVAGEARSFDFPAELTEHSPDATNAFVEKLWASRRVGQIIDEIDLHGKNQELIDELIALSKRHGILTPYTSFLADENSRPHDLAAVRGATSLALESLEQVSGAQAVGQRQVKAEFRSRMLAPAAGLVKTYDLQAEREVTVHSVTRVAGKTFFLRNGRWIDSAVTDQQAAGARRVERYSPEYFELIRKQGRDVARCLSLDGDLTLEIHGAVYSFEHP